MTPLSLNNIIGLLNYTTKIDADKTISEIQKVLSRMGASKIMTDYKDGVISVMSFALEVNGQQLGFRLPCDWRATYDVLTKDHVNPYSWNQEKKDHWESEKRMQAVRTSWRIIKDWIEAQMALIETSMVKTEEIFLPYLVTSNGDTLYKQISKSQFQLGDGK